MNGYQIDKIIGEGSFGKALLCRRVDDDKRCIIKQISLGHLTPKEAKQTQQEASLLERLNHPNIVSFWESFIKGSNLFIVMEFADGGDLDQFIRRRRGRLLSEGKVLQLFVQISLAIKHTHDRKVLHRDLKPGNIFLTSSGLVKLGDFGVSRVLKNTGEFAATQIGTPYYMSPEIMDNKRYNSKTDIWSLGCILYEIMCLRLPFEGNSMQELSKNVQTGNGGVICSSLHFSQPLQDLVRDMLLRNSTLRPGINAILGRPVVKACISTFLDASVKCKEFSHTVIHGMNILSVEPSVSKLSGLSGRRDTENYSDETKRGSGKGVEEIRVEQGDSRERGLREQEKQEVQKMIKKRDEANSPLGPQDRRAPSAFKYDQAVVRVKQPLQQDPNPDVARKERPGYSREEILLRARKAEIKAENEEAFAMASRQALERKRAYEKEAIRLMRRGDGQEKERKQSPMRVERVENVAKEKGKEKNAQSREKNSSIELRVVDEKISASIRDAEEMRKLAAQRDMKAKQNLLRFEKERMDRQRKLVKKADANAKIVFQRQQDMLYQAPPRAPQHSPSPTPRPSPSLSPIPPVPSLGMANGGRAEMKEPPRKVSHVSPVRDSHKPSRSAAGAGACADIEMKSSSVETADILQVNMPSRTAAQNLESQIQDPKNMVWKEEFRGIAGGHHVPTKQSGTCEDETVEAGECEDVVSPFIFSGHAMPWRHEDPTQPWGNVLEGEAPSVACVAAAVEYSELFSQMQDILEHSSSPRPQGKKASKRDQNKQADQGPSRHQLYDCDGGESDDTFGDEDEGCYDDANGQI